MLLKVAVPLILHALTLPSGAEIFWRMLDDDFTDDDWRVRFAAVEKATLVFRFLEDRPVKKCPAVRTVLAHAFCCVIASMDDIDVHVGQRATLLLGTIHDHAVRNLIHSLEYQGRSHALAALRYVKVRNGYMNESFPYVQTDVADF